MASSSISIQRLTVWVLGVLAITLSVNCQGASRPRQEMVAIEGTATYRERIALPPNAIFDAILEDVTHADKGVLEIGRTTIEGPSSPPIAFSITFGFGDIDPKRVYSVRAYILVDGRPRFVSEAAHSVLTRGARHNVDIVLRMVTGKAPDVATDAGRSAAAPASSFAGAHGLGLPATFRGDLPCADCEAIRYHLDLWPDQVFHLRRDWVGKNFVHDEVGRWRVDPIRQALILSGGGEVPLEFEIKGHDKLRQLDLQGKPIVSSLPYELASSGTLTPSDLSLPLGGEMTYLADAARFTECQTGRSYPVAQEGDFVKMQRAYLAVAKEPGARLYVTFEGSITNRPKMEGDGMERTVVANRFINAWPNERCERAMANPSLTNTYWRIVRVGGALVSAMQGRREPHLLLRDVGERKGYAATIGCNQLVGGYTIEGEAISFTGSATTLMACPAPLDELEKKLGETLGKTKRWRITGNSLEFFDERGAAAAFFEAVYF